MPELNPVAVPPRPAALRFEIEAYAGQRFAADTATATITIFEPISDITLDRVAAALREIGPRLVTVQISSLGGDPFAGTAIFNALRQHAQANGVAIRTETLGTAASAASLIFCAGDERLLAKSATVMIHRAVGGGLGNTDDMRALAEALASIDAGMATIYADTTGLTAAEIDQLMRAESWFDQTRALELGFATGLLPVEALPPPERVDAHAGQAQSRQEVERALRASGFTRSVAARMAAAWAKTPGPDNQGGDPLDVAALAHLFAAHHAAYRPYQS